jgi:hypothetical protein
MSLSEHETQGERVRALFDVLRGIERELWAVVVVMLLADVWLTHVGIEHGLREGNPAVRALIEMFGIGALAALKGTVLGLAGLVAEAVPAWQTPVIPLGLALPWLAAVLVNGALLVVM